MSDIELNVPEQKPKCHIVLIVDESGSMSDCRDATISSLKEKLDMIRSKAEEFILSVTVVYFSDTYRYIIYNKSIAFLEDFNIQRYLPNSSTALYDTCGEVIEHIRDLVDKDTNVLVDIITDGEDNQSRKVTPESIKTLIEILKSTGKWTFGFIGIGEKAFTEGKLHFGINTTVRMAQANLVGSQRHFDTTNTAYKAYFHNVVTNSLSTGELYSSENITEEPKK